MNFPFINSGCTASDILATDYKIMHLGWSAWTLPDSEVMTVSKITFNTKTIVNMLNIILQSQT